MHKYLLLVGLSEGNMNDTFSNIFACLSKCEIVRDSLKGNDELKISFLEKEVLSYRNLTEIFLATGNSSEALYAAELGRARALADLMSAQYGLNKQIISVNPQSWAGIERTFREKERNCLCLYIFYSDPQIVLWILRPNKPTIFRRINVKHCAENGGLITDLDKFLRKDIVFRKFHVSSEGHYEDRSLFSVNDIQLTQKLTLQDSSAVFRLVEDNDEENLESEPSLSLYYKLIISPVAELLGKPAELIFVPDRAFYSVPFAALRDENGKYLSETFRIRIVPSLMTLNLIQGSPVDYHSQTGALIVGDPEVGDVIYKGRFERKPPLPGARKEAEMIGRLLGLQPLLGEHATKQAVLKGINSVSLIHFAAHGNAERGEIALAPLQPTTGFSQEEEYLLTMSDISKVQLRAKLVVLSCCHSGRGQIKSEGIVGIARAFLGSSARSVLVALWALDDNATEQFMRRF